MTIEYDETRLMTDGELNKELLELLSEEDMCEDGLFTEKRRLGIRCYVRAQTNERQSTSKKMKYGMRKCVATEPEMDI